MGGWVKTGINKTLDFKLLSSSSNNFYCTFLEDIENLFTKVLMITDSFLLVIKFKIMLPITLVPIRPRHLKLNVTCYNICCLHGALEIGASQSKQKTRTLTLTEVWHSYYDPMRAQDIDRPDQSEAIWHVMTMGHISRVHICHSAMLCPSDGQLWAHCPGIFKFKITKWTILAVLASGVYWVRVACW